MRFFVILITVIFIPICNIANATETETQILRAKGAISFFNKVCFMNYANQKKRIEFLDSTFPKHEGKKKEIFLKIFKAKDGEVWAAVFKQASYAIVVEKNQNCHLVAHQADEQEIHNGIKKLSESAKKSQPEMQVKYGGVSGSEQKYSGFVVIDPNDSNLIIVVSTTINNPPDNKPAAKLSMIVNKAL